MTSCCVSLNILNFWGTGNPPSLSPPPNLENYFLLKSRKRFFIENVFINNHITPAVSVVCMNAAFVLSCQMVRRILPCASAENGWFKGWSVGPFKHYCSNGGAIFLWLHHLKSETMWLWPVRQGSPAHSIVAQLREERQTTWWDDLHQRSYSHSNVTMVMRMNLWHFCNEVGRSLYLCSTKRRDSHEFQPNQNTW